MPQGSSSKGGGSSGRVSMRKPAPKGNKAKQKMELTRKKKKVSAKIHNHIENEMRKRLAQDGGSLKHISAGPEPKSASGGKLKFKPRSQNKNLISKKGKKS